MPTAASGAYPVIVQGQGQGEGNAVQPWRKVIKKSLKSILLSFKISQLRRL